jgi:hypothetical protein
VSRGHSLRWHRHWFTGGSAFDLAALRIAVAGWHLVVLASAGAIEHLAELARQDPSTYDAPWLLDLVTLGFRPPGALVGFVHVLAIGAALVATLGWRTRAATAVLAASVMLLRCHDAAYEPIHHDDALPALALVFLALSPCGDALSIDARKRGISPGRCAPPIDSWAHAWAPRLIAWLLAIAYGSAFASKMVTSGPGWADGATLQFYGYYRGLPHGRELGLWLSEHASTARVASALVLAFESTFALAILYPRLRWFHVPAAIALHVLGDLALAADFSGFVALQAALVPWSKARDLLRRRFEGREELPVRLLQPAPRVPCPAHVPGEVVAGERGSSSTGRVAPEADPSRR